MSVIDSLANIFMNERATEQNIVEAQRSRNFSEYMWNKANVYNSPANQKALLKQAGLNPNMLYSQGGVDATADLADTNAQASANSPNPVSIDPLATLGQLQTLDLQSVNIQREKIKRQQDEENLNLIRESLTGEHLNNTAKRLEMFAKWFDAARLRSAFDKAVDARFTSWNPDEGTYTATGFNPLNDAWQHSLDSMIRGWQAEGISVDESKARIEEIRMNLKVMQKEIDAADGSVEQAQAFARVLKSLPDNVFGDVCRLIVSWLYGSTSASFR